MRADPCSRLASFPLLLFAVAVILSGCGGTSSDDGEPPGQVAQSFYEFLLHEKLTGLPVGEAWTALEPMVTIELAAAVEAARREQEEFIRAHPDEKPPWIEGDLFSSAFEGPREFVVGETRIEDGEAEVRLHFADGSGPERVEWTDVISLVETGAGWRIADVYYGGQMEFGNGGTLLDSLAPEASPVSPDGRFMFVRFSPAEVADQGKPAFGITESGSGNLVWSAPEGLGDPERPEEALLWSPDGRRFCLASRVGTRYVDSFFFEWNGETFIERPWEGGPELENQADARVLAAARAEGVTEAATRGRTIAGETRPVRWIDGDTLVMRRYSEFTVGEGEKEGAFDGSARAQVAWDPEKESFVLQRQLGPRLFP